MIGSSSSTKVDLHTWVDQCVEPGAMGGFWLHWYYAKRAAYPTTHDDWRSVHGDCEFIEVGGLGRLLAPDCVAPAHDVVAFSSRRVPR